MRLLRIFIPALLTATLFCGCEKELDFDYIDIEPIPVIEGTLTATGARVGITLTTPMDEPIQGTLLTDATVSLADLTVGTEELLEPDAEGYYVSAGAGVANHDYRLTVSRDGATYSAESRMTPPVEILGLEFSWVGMPYDDVAALQVSFRDNDPGERGTCYWVRLYRNGEPYMWTEIKDDLAIDGIIYEVVMTSRKDTDAEDDDTVLREGDVVTASVTQISRAMHDYLAAIASDSNGPRMFAGDFCLGYFLAGEVATASVTYHPSEIEPY